MSGLAHILLSRGFSVSGSDLKALLPTNLRPSAPESSSVNRKISQRISIWLFTPQLFPRIIRTESSRKVRHSGDIPCDFLGADEELRPCSLCCRNTRKTTTTLAACANHAGCGNRSNDFIGGILPAIDGNIRIGHSDYFITEACEYRNSFLSFFPTMGIITNVQNDHPIFSKI